MKEQRVPGTPPSLAAPRRGPIAPLGAMGRTQRTIMNNAGLTDARRFVAHPREILRLVPGFRKRAATSEFAPWFFNHPGLLAEPRRADFRELYLRRRRLGSLDDHPPSRHVPRPLRGLSNKGAHGAPGEDDWNNPHSIDGPAGGETWGSVFGFGGQDPTRQGPDRVRSGCLSCRCMAAGHTSNVRGTASGSLRS